MFTKEPAIRVGSHKGFHSGRQQPFEQMFRLGWKWMAVEHSSLLQYGNNYVRKKFYSAGPSGLYYKSFTIVIYNRNTSGQHYKTAITAKASLS